MTSAKGSGVASDNPAAATGAAAEADDKKILLEALVVGGMVAGALVQRVHFAVFSAHTPCNWTIAIYVRLHLPSQAKSDQDYSHKSSMGPRSSETSLGWNQLRCWARQESAF